MKNQHTQQPIDQKDAPPIMGTWQRLYILILVLHAIILSLFFLFTKTYS